MTKFTCLVNRNVGAKIQWYRYLKNTGSTEMVDPDDNHITVSTHTGNTINSSLIITNANRSHTGYYWVGLPSNNSVCNVSLTVGTSA